MTSVASDPCPIPAARRVRRAARELWLSHGYSISMNAVAEKAGVSKQTVYTHFGTKDELFSQVIDELIAPVTVALDSSSDDIRSSLLHFARHHADFVTGTDATSQRRRLIAEFERFPEPSRSAFTSASDAVCARLSDLLDSWMQRGLLRRENPAELAELLLAMIHGLEPNRLLFDLAHRSGEEDRERWIVRAIDTFLLAWATAPAAATSASNLGTTR